MPIYRYRREIKVADGDQVRLRIEFPDNATAAPHIIDLPGTDDRDRTNEVNEMLGSGATLKTERTIINSKPFNFDKNNPYVRVNYYINEKLEVAHTNPKNEDNSPLVIVTFNFVS
ncbi:MAG: hypothetical protein L6Q81_05080 [Bacteroidia bacterium]|nr:hypothetical protein [Bacteroidia bacterium]